jgi:hypothetical protein
MATICSSRAMVQAVNLCPLTAEAGFEPWSMYVEFVVDKVALWRGFLRVFRFSAVALHNNISSGGWIIGPLVAAELVSSHRHEHHL